MILSSEEIKKRLGKDIIIKPFNTNQLGSQSYNLTLADSLLVYNDTLVDMKTSNQTTVIYIPKDGIILRPNIIYLSKTVEYTETYNLVPEIQGRSSIARLGLYIHVNCPYGGIGFRGNWTLEMHCVQPIRIYSGVQICQIFYHEVLGKIYEYNGPKYQDATDIGSSKIYYEFGQHEEWKQ
jgi:dCTP deaminase